MCGAGVGIRLGYRAGSGLELGLGSRPEVRVNWKGEITMAVCLVYSECRLQEVRNDAM
jgi:hypothetical protein